MPMHTCFGDGSEIPVRYMNHVRQKIYQNMIFNRWKKGDILMIDNFRVSHGRQVLVNTLFVYRWDQLHIHINSPDCLLYGYKFQRVIKFRGF